MKNFSITWRTILYTLGIGFLMEITLMLVGLLKGHEIGYLIALPIGFLLAKKQTIKLHTKTKNSKYNGTEKNEIISYDTNEKPNLEDLERTIQEAKKNILK